MCEQCDKQLAYAIKEFNGALGQYKDDIAEGHVRDTEGMRVHDLANTLCDFMFQGPKGFYTVAWMMALCMDRTAFGLRPDLPAPCGVRGVDFRLVVQAVNEKRTGEGRAPIEPDEITEIFDVASLLSSGTTLGEPE